MGRGYRFLRCSVTLLVCIVCVRFQFEAWRHDNRERSVKTTPCKYLNNSYTFDNNYLITWYNINPFIKLRPEAMHRGFIPCKCNNCHMSLCKQSSEQSDVVIFDGRRVPEKYEFKRKVGQIWVFAEDEAPYTYDLDGGYWKSNFWRNAFNWSMTYDRLTSDIYLPYGEIRKKNIPDIRDFLKIAKSKSRDALIITSHCNTKSKRLQYVKKLQKYIEVDILGSCGRRWKCGEQYVHNDCFSILNSTYRFYLAFENALCREYRTEKFFENFNYDIIVVARNGISADDAIEPKEVYISTSDFANVEHLGKYLYHLSKNVYAYAQLLHKKSQYYSPGFHESYQMALCRLCEKMNNIENNRRQIHDLVENVQGANPCRYLSD